MYLNPRINKFQVRTKVRIPLPVECQNYASFYDWNLHSTFFSSFRSVIGLVMCVRWETEVKCSWATRSFGTHQIYGFGSVGMTWDRCGIWQRVRFTEASLVSTALGSRRKKNIIFLLVSLEDPAYSKEHQRRRVTFGLNGRLFVRSFGFYLRAVSTQLMTACQAN